MQTPIATTAKPMIAEPSGGKDKNLSDDATQIAFLDVVIDAGHAGEETDSLASARGGERQGMDEMAGQDADQVTALFTLAGAQPLPVAQGPLQRKEEMQPASEGLEKSLAQAISVQGQVSAANGENTARVVPVQTDQRGFFGKAVGRKEDSAQPTRHENAALALGGYLPDPAVSDVSALSQPAPDGRSGVQTVEATGIPIASSMGLESAGRGQSSDNAQGRGPGQMRLDAPGIVSDAPGMVSKAPSESMQAPIAGGFAAKSDASPALQPGAPPPPKQPPSAAPLGQESKAIPGAYLPSGVQDPGRSVPPGMPTSIPPGKREPASRVVTGNAGESLKESAAGIGASKRRPTQEVLPPISAPSGQENGKKTPETGPQYGAKTPQSGLSPDGYVVSVEQTAGRKTSVGDSAPPRVGEPEKPQPGGNQGSRPFPKPAPVSAERAPDRPPGRPAVSPTPQSGAASAEVSLQRPGGPPYAGPDAAGPAPAAEVPGQRPFDTKPRTAGAESKAPALPDATALSPRAGAIANTTARATAPRTDNGSGPQPEAAPADPELASAQSRSEGRGEIRTDRPATQAIAAKQKVTPEFPARATQQLDPGDATDDSLAAPLDTAQSARGHTAPTVPHSPAGEPALARHVAGQIAELARRPANGPVELVLSPEELGRVRMVMTIDHGTLNVAVVAERAETQDLMRRHIEMLAQDLRAVGYRDVSFSFGAGNGAQNRSGPGAEQPASSQPDTPIPPAHEASGNHSPGAAPPGPATIPGRVDIRL